jgi:hypothetical protein
MDEVLYGPNLEGELTMFPALGLHWTSTGHQWNVQWDLTDTFCE